MRDRPRRGARWAPRRRRARATRSSSRAGASGPSAGSPSAPAASSCGGGGAAARRRPTTRRRDDDDDEPPRPSALPRAWTTAAGLVLDGGGEMNFTGVHRPFGGVRRPTRIRFRTSRRRGPRRGATATSASRPPMRRTGRCASSGSATPYARSSSRSGPATGSSSGRRGRGAVALAGPDEAAADAKHDVDCRLLWDVAGEIGAPALWMDVRVDGRRHHDGPLAMKLPSSYDGLRHVYLFNWVQDENTFVGTPPAQRPPSPVSNARCVISDLFVEDGPVDAEFLTNVRSEARRRAECPPASSSGSVRLGVGVQSAGTDPVIVVEGDPQARTRWATSTTGRGRSGDDDDASIFRTTTRAATAPTPSRARTSTRRTRRTRALRGGVLRRDRRRRRRRRRGA